ncbi:HAD-IA family hydrolase [Shewanella xiamenensis]|uniref:HAD family hydrolase n=1 Tax=Shewanella xiamenensis TaxID=332186 RepID=UPI00313EF056
MITRLTDIELEQIRGVIFDLDGTLAHSNPDFKGLRAALGIGSGTDILEHIHSLETTMAKMQALEIVHDYELASSRQASWIGGAQALIAFLKARQLPLAILTRNMPEAAKITIEKLGIDIPLVLTRYDAEPKPHPQGIHLICEQWQLSPADILYVGDYLFDLQTAQNAGSRCALYCPEEVPDYALAADLLIGNYQSFIEAWAVAIPKD